MAMKSRSESSFVMFDVVYEDGTVRSNRRVPAHILGGLDGDTPALLAIEEQDREIARMSGRPAVAVKSIARANGKPPEPGSGGKAARGSKRLCL